MATNAAIVLVAVAIMWLVGVRPFLLVQVPIILIAASIGVWLFYIQHQFEDDYWERHENWDPMMAALKGSSYYKLPKVLQWFSGNIGLHHIHHLRPGIPNYNLQRCQDEIPELQAVKPLTLLTSFRSLFLHLWDETDHKLVGFRFVRADRLTQVPKRDAQCSR